MRDGRTATARPAIPENWGAALRQCPFRSFVGVGSDANEMMTRLDHAFAAIGGEPAPIDVGLLDEMVASIRAGRVVLIIADRADLRDHAKRQILAQVHGAAGMA